MCLDYAFELRVLVAAGEEQRTVEEVGEACAEEVETVSTFAGVCARDRVVDGGPREGANGKVSVAASPTESNASTLPFGSRAT